VTFAPGAVDFGAIACRYGAARGLTPVAADAWRAAVGDTLRVVAGERLLDLGAGVGRFTPLLAAWSTAYVVGVEPAAAMRAEAARSASHPHATYVGGRAEALPFRDECFAAAWLAFVVHHVPDLARCAAEVRRVVHVGGSVLVANAFAGRLEGITFFNYFPEARAVAERFPSVDVVTGVFAAAGVRCEAVRRVAQPTCGSLEELAARTRLRADSTLRSIPDAAFMRGQAALEHAARTEPPLSVIDTLDLLVCRVV